MERIRTHNIMVVVVIMSITKKHRWPIPLHLKDDNSCVNIIESNICWHFRYNTIKAMMIKTRFLKLKNLHLSGLDVLKPYFFKLVTLKDLMHLPLKSSLPKKMKIRVILEHIRVRISLTFNPMRVYKD